MQIIDDRDRAILKLAQVAAEGNCLYEPPPQKVHKASTLHDTWWHGIVLAPSKDRPGLLPPIVFAGKYTTWFLNFSQNHFDFFRN